MRWQYEREERKTMSDRDFIIGELEKLVANLKGTIRAAPAAGGSVPSAAGAFGDALGQWKRARVTFWNVEQKEGPKGPYVRAALYVAWTENGESKSEKMSSINQRLIESIDPLNKGDTIEYQSEANGKFVNFTAVRKTNR